MRGARAAQATAEPVDGRQREWLSLAASAARSTALPATSASRMSASRIAASSKDHASAGVDDDRAGVDDDRAGADGRHTNAQLSLGADGTRIKVTTPPSQLPRVA